VIIVNIVGKPAIITGDSQCNLFVPRCA